MNFIRKQENTGMKEIIIDLNLKKIKMKTRSQQLIIVLIAVLLLCSTMSIAGCTSKKVGAIPYSESYYYA